MIIKRNKQFSDDDEIKRERMKGAALVGGGVATGAAFHKFGDKMYKKASADIRWSRNDGSVAEKAKRKLIKNARKKGITFVENSAGNSAYLGVPAGKLWRRIAGKYVVSAKTKEKRQARFEKVDKYVRKLTHDVAGLSSVGKKRVSLGNYGTLSDVDVLAHELGHAEHLIKKGSGSKLGKIVHRIQGDVATKLGKPLVTSAGVISGYSQEKNRQEGKGTKYDKYVNFIFPAVAGAGMLASEAAASKKGLQLMKEAGANRHVMKRGKERLTAAWKTYFPHVVRGVAYGTGGTMVGMGAAKLTAKKNKGEEQHDSEKK